jgi:hypothetical protein
MQTFLPYSDFRESARVLDQKRLGKQRVETLQIMQALVEGRGYVNHPAVHMWAGYERALLHYQEVFFFEWAARRGYRDTCLEQTEHLYISLNRRRDRLVAPPWLGNDRFHLGHQSNLVRKKPEHYGPLFPGVPDDIEYWWPTKN